MDIGVYSIKDVSDAKIELLIDGGKSFVLENISRLNMADAVKSIEHILDAKGLKYRTYTSFRATAIAGAAVPATAFTTAIVVFAGLAAAVAIGAHRLATWNPDYELARNFITGTLSVTFKGTSKESTTTT